MYDTPTQAIGNAGGLPDLGSLMGDFVAQNPQLAWLPQMLAMQQQMRAAAPAVAEPGAEEIEQLQQALAQSESRAARLQRATRRLAGELETAQALLSDLAAAFGACGLCWGEDDGCPSCRGRGRPGRFAPDPDMRMRFATEPLEPPAASRFSTPLATDSGPVGHPGPTPRR